MLTPTSSLLHIFSSLIQAHSVALTKHYCNFGWQYNTTELKINEKKFSRNSANFSPKIIENKLQVCDFSRYFSCKGKKLCHQMQLYWWQFWALYNSIFFGRICIIIKLSRHSDPPNLMCCLLLSWLLSDSPDLSWNSENKEKIAYLKHFFCDLRVKFYIIITLCYPIMSLPVSPLNTPCANL